MKKQIVLSFVAVATLLLSFKAVESTVWTLDAAHAKVGFSITHLMVSDVDGYFKKVSATITSKNADLSDAVAEMSAEVASVNTDNEGRDAHLQSPDFFDATKFPTVNFKSTSFQKTKVANVYLVKGNLTMHGITKPVVFNAIGKFGTNPMQKKDIVGFKITGKIKRADFNIASSMPSAMLGSDVTIFANAEFVKN